VFFDDGIALQIFGDLLSDDVHSEKGEAATTGDQRHSSATEKGYNEYHDAAAKIPPWTRVRILDGKHLIVRHEWIRPARRKGVRPSL
jgi:hypothetical protein